MNVTYEKHPMKQLLILATIIFLLVPTGYAQVKDQKPKPTVSERLAVPAANPLFGPGYILGLIDPARLSMSHSYSMGAAIGGGGSSSYGLYMNHIQYGINDKMALNLDLGYLHDPLSSFRGPAPAFDSGKFIGSGRLTYFPTDNIQLNIGIGNYPMYYNTNPIYGYRR